MELRLDDSNRSQRRGADGMDDGVPGGTAEVVGAAHVTVGTGSESSAKEFKLDGLKSSV